MVGRWAACWRAPPPNMYRLQPVFGYSDHDFTKKRAPAWSFDRYLPAPRPKPVVSLSPFQIQFKKMQRKKMARRKKYEKRKMMGAESGLVGPGGQAAYWRRWCNNRARQKAKKFKNGKRTDSAGTSLYTIATIDKAKKLESFDSGKYVVPPDQTCNFCYPWTKKDGKRKSETGDRNKRGGKTLTPNTGVENQKDRHNCIVIQPGIGEKCEQHSFRRISVPLGGLQDDVNWLPKLPRPPADETPTMTQCKKVTHRKIDSQGQRTTT